MSYLNKHIPVPYIKINSTGRILEYSTEAFLQFDLEGKNIDSIVDQESQSKLNKFLSHSKEVHGLELNFHTRIRPLVLFDVHISWDEEESAHLVLILKDDSNRVLEEKLLALQNRLANTNVELLEKKELLENTLNRLNRLSGPFIPVTKELALVPLFGDLSIEKMNDIISEVIKHAHEKNYEVIVFDFNASGILEMEGVNKLHDLFQLLRYMGIPEIIVVGIKPNHAKVLHLYEQNWPVSFESSLKKVLTRANL